jgi:HK97 family phage major capsid protein
MELREILKNLLAERAKTWDAARADLEAVKAEGRELEGEAKEKYERQTGELDDLDERITSVKELIEREATAEEARELADDLGRRATEEQEGEPTGRHAQDEAALRKLVNGETRRIELRFEKGESRAVARGERRDLNTTDDSSIVPTSFVNLLYEHLIDNSAIRQTRVNVINTDSGEALQVPKTTAHPTAALISEGTAITESEPTFGQVTLNAFKYGILTQAANELLTDTGVDLVSYLAKIGGQALANGSGAHFVTGDGSSKPRGIVPASTLGKTAAGAATVTFDEIIDLFFSVIGPYRANAEWMLKDSSMAIIRKLKDADGQYLWQPALTAGEPDRILGKPYHTDPNMPAMTTGLKSLLFGDFSAYTIRDVNGIRIERSDDFAFDSDMVTWRFILRTDGDLIDSTGAVKHLIQA